jgi:predicted alpha/beta hydrolase family esterase
VTPDSSSPPTRAILIHGNGGSTAGDLWFPWLEHELSALGLEVINQTFPDNIKARAKIWLPFLDELGADERTILVGHSSGAVAAMRYAETHRIAGSILVSVCHSDLGDADERASGYYAAPWQWQRIRENQPWIAIYQSTDDPLIPVAEARFVASQLKGSYFEFKDRGHFVDQNDFPEVVSFVRARIAR